MKKLPSVFTSSFNSTSITYFITIKIFKIPFRAVTLPFDITLNSEVYTANNKLVAIQPPSSTSVINRSSYQIALSDVDLVFKDAFESSLVGSRLQVKMGVFNSNTGIPSLGANDLLTIYDGLIDSTSISANLQEGTLVANIESSSPLASLDKRNTLYSSKRYLRDKYPSDCSFDFVHVGSGSSILKWGKP